MEVFDREREPLRRQFKRLEEELQKLLAAKPLDLPTITANFRTFTDAYSPLLELDEKAWRHLMSQEASPELEDKELSVTSDYRKRAERMRIQVEQITNDATSTIVSAPQSVSSGEKRRIKLPMVEIKKFSGDLLDWLRFWGQFEKIHLDDSLHESDKLWYLEQYMEPGSEPALLVAGIPPSEASYSETVKALKRRFGNEDMLLQVYVRELLKLVIRNAHAEKKEPFKDLFVKLDSYLRALKVLNLEKADPVTWLFPLVESSLPPEVLSNWSRSHLSTTDGSTQNPPKTRLDLLMSFMEKEMNIQQRIEMTRSFNPIPMASSKEKKEARDVTWKRKPIPTTAGFFTANSKKCLFCGRSNHSSQDCYAAQKMTRDKKKSLLRKKGACYNCFENHVAKTCRNREVVCARCNKNHYTIMCTNGEAGETKNTMDEPPTKRARTESTPQPTVHMATHSVSSEVILQTVLIKLVNGEKEKIVRAVMDSCSQRSYILKSTAEELDLEPNGFEKTVHSLLGGRTTEVTFLRKYDLNLHNLSGTFNIVIPVRDYSLICANLPPVTRNHALWEELRKHEISLSDVGHSTQTIEVMLGADVYGKILTGKLVEMECGPVAIETKFGWTLLGELAKVQHNMSFSIMTINMAVSDQEIAKLWELDQIGISDPIKLQSQNEQEEEVKAKLIDSLERTEDGRYSVALPWKEGFPLLPTNYEIAKQRLMSTTKKLNQNKLYEAYDELFKSWEKEGFIQRVERLDPGAKGHYLPHRAVVKPESLTTPVRPVFDASCRSGRFPSLNDCLYKGPNMIMLIPDILSRFREKLVGFSADIRKAFQMIGVNEKDRDYLRFLWWDDEKQNIIEFRHARVPFGATCSPFILGAILEHHLMQLKGSPKEQLGRELLSTLYVDNSLGSVSTQEEYEKFKNESITILKDACMDLRLWESNVDNFHECSNHITKVLGLNWDRMNDVIYVEVTKIDCPEKVTKKTVLSTVQKIFDPIGFTSPATLPVKQLLQRSWILKNKWDEELPMEEVAYFKQWCSEISQLGAIKIPRLITGGVSDKSKWQIHTFCDASLLHGYGAVVYLRTEENGTVNVQLVAAKARVSPLGGSTIPRLELLSCLIGARLGASFKESLNLENVEEFFWSDSTTALAWITWNEQWGTFVDNRTMEILKLTNPDNWYHVPGEINPADLPSRGCKPSELLASKWWEGPAFLKKPRDKWPSSSINVNEEEVMKERRKSLKAVSMSVLQGIEQDFSFRTTVRITAWVLRFIYNARQGEQSKRRCGDPSREELEEAEKRLLKSIQIEFFTKEKLKSLKGIEVLKDEDGLLRVKTRLVYRNDEHSFKFPVLLPGKHPLIRRMIMDTHIAYCHAGVGFLVTNLRRKYWILHTRQSVRNVTGKCYRCRQFDAKHCITKTAALPEDRVKNGNPFSVTGVDLAGPLYLKSGKKVWLVIYTCALYRAVHFDLVTSLSTNDFITSLEKFILKFTRPDVIYCDNGTNFRGADNLFRKMDWSKITENTGLKPIVFKFSPPTGSWFGGFWESLIKSAKDLIRRTVGKASLNMKELERVVSSVGDVMNQRPLTYVSEDPSDLEALTPDMFIHPYGYGEFPEKELLDGNELRVRYRHVQTLQKDLRERWRKEYIGMLRTRSLKPTRALKVGELVMVGDDNKRRADWELARVMELFPGKDGVPRVARIKARDGEYIRPVMRLYPLELENEEGLEKVEVTTRSGRKVKLPDRFK